MASWEPQPAERPEPVPAVIPPRIPPGGRRELGLFGWLFCKLAARVTGVPEIHLFTVFAQHRRLFWSWAPFGGVLLRRGRLPGRDTEVVILRVGHLRNSDYELQQHRRIALKRGVDQDTQAAVFAWPQADGLSSRDQALLTGVDELLATRMVSDETWQRLAGHLGRRQLMEFVMLVGQYDALAMWLNTLGVPMDYPD
ncbi:carboxymuconolactone decarboxylase family protein [Mycobacterium sp. Y57]|uniref:carboxymuconolactone decarboxylase family protein n=1 Tax=Mycolicibacterium xanthum TaxID=2796469 RepID=UPI001C844965|nr:carboxymuconolactone decarboxylase family protein [Mycolicibacterium xanthum]MBX7434876.1 carboxymuconolactone decarboxylase family protein [Mycolicibacterium xanthum]